MLCGVYINIRKNIYIQLVEKTFHAQFLVALWPAVRNLQFDTIRTMILKNRVTSHMKKETFDQLLSTKL